MPYTEAQQVEFLELAKEIGITGAKRELGFPKSWVTGKKWADAHGISIEVDELKAKAASTREWYKNEEKITVGQEILSNISARLNEPGLTADDLKKLSSSYKGVIETLNLIEGKATNITQDNPGIDDAFDEAYRKLLEDVS